MDMLTTLLAVAVVALVGALWRIVVLRERAPVVPPLDLLGVESDQIRKEIGAEFAELRKEFGELRTAVAHGIEHVERTERRIKSSVQRARAKLADLGLEDDGLEAEDREISRWDGGGGEGTRMPVLPQSLGPPQSSIPGVSPEQLQRVRGL